MKKIQNIYEILFHNIVVVGAN